MRLIIALALVVALTGCQTARDLPPEQTQVEAVHEVAGKTKGEIYNRALEWFAKSITDSKSALEIQDRETGLIMGKIILPGGASTVIGTRMPLRVTIKIETKDGKYRATFDGFILPDRSIDQSPGVGIELDSAMKTARELDAELAAFIAKAAAKDF
jgi:Domain of unknown function (DUF4468) with TBP-like fold